MNAKIKALWIERLRSGEYRQIRQFLSDTSNGRCCLGVLCDLAVEAGIARREGGALRVLYAAVADGEDSAMGILPTAVGRWAGLTSRDPDIGPASATELNDSKGMSFAEIADEIERYL